MCGISGIINQKSQHILHSDSDKLQNSLSVMKSRGPDSQASCQGKNWLLGHTRLSIIDLAGGKQPMQDEATGVTLSYNGEIYNFKTLRDELISKGHSFLTSSDTEVLLRSYLEWDMEFLDKINGCFAFGIIDPRKNELLLVRDRLGVKPLYYCIKDGTTTFASSVAALRKIVDVSEIDYNAISHYLTTCRITFKGRTLFKGINSLNPGTWMKFKLDSTDSESGTYWKRPVLSAEDKEEISAEDAKESVHELVQQAVVDRLISDVPVGCFLSGGLDSAVVTYEATKNSNINYPFFCAGTPYEKYNEFKYAKEMADSLKADLEEVHISPETFFEDWKMLISEKGLPLSTPNETSIYRLSKALGQQCKVALTGEGSDEIFGGYLMPHFGVYDYLKSPKSEEEAEGHPLQWKLMQRYGRSFFFNEADHFFLTHSWMPIANKMQTYSEFFWNEIDEDDEVFCFYEDFIDNYSQCSAFDRRMHIHAEINLEGLLNRVDSSTMAASIEARVPFTDHRLVEFAFKQSDNWKMDYINDEVRKSSSELLVDELDKDHLVETKRLLRSTYRNKLPVSITDRKKMSFPVPFQEWLSGPLTSELMDFCKKTSEEYQLFKPEVVEQMFLSGNRNIWLIANLCLWLKNA